MAQELLARELLARDFGPELLAQELLAQELLARPMLHSPAPLAKRAGAARGADPRAWVHCALDARLLDPNQCLNHTTTIRLAGPGRSLRRKLKRVKEMLVKSRMSGPDPRGGFGGCGSLAGAGRCCACQSRRSDQDRLWHGAHRSARRQRQNVVVGDAGLGSGHQRQGRIARPPGEARLLRRSEQSVASAGIYSKLLDIDKVDLIVSGYASTQIAAGHADRHRHEKAVRQSVRHRHQREVQLSDDISR